MDLEYQPAGVVMLVCSSPSHAANANPTRGCARSIRKGSRIGDYLLRAVLRDVLLDLCCRMCSLDVVLSDLDLALLVDHEGRADHALNLLPIHHLLAEGA